MFKRITLILALGAALIVPANVRADRVLESPWFWGPAGLVTGGVAGYLIGRESRRPTPVPYSPAYYSNYQNDGPINGTGAYYVRDKYAFPFYHKTEIYPIASTMPKVYRPQAFSMVTGGAYSEPPALGARPEDEKQGQGVNVSLGDNNKNVTISITAPSDGQSGEQKETKVVQIENQEDSLPGRVVDVKVPVEKDQSKAKKTQKSADEEASLDAKTKQ